MADEGVFKLKYNDTVSSLSQAAAFGDLKTVQALLRRGLLPQATDNRGWSAVHSCVAANELECLKLILNFRKGNKKYLTNLTTWEGETPLLIAMKNDTVSVDIVKLLLKSGSAVNKATNEGMTPLHYACKKTGNCNTVELLIKRGARVDAKEYINEYTPLHFAIVEAADIEIIKLLIEKCDAGLSDADNETPLYKACVCNFLEAAELILEKNTSSVNVIPRSMFPPLSAATVNGNENLVKLLLAAGAKTDTPGSAGFHRYPLNEGQTLPIHLSVGNPDIFRLFLRVTNPRILLKHEQVAPLAVYAMMYGRGSETFEALLQTPLPEELDHLKIVDIDKVADFITGCPGPCGETLRKFQLLFKYCIHLEAGDVFRNITSKTLQDKLPFLRLLAKIGIPSETKNKVVQALKEIDQDKPEVAELVDILRQPVLTLKQLSRDAVRRFITYAAANKWAAHITIGDLPLPAHLKDYLWCQVLS